MSRYIDADKMQLDLDERKWVVTDHMYSWISSLIEMQPTADVVEVVRCKDCVHWGGATYGFVCRKFSGIDTKICMGADHYCSYGERKEE